MRYSRWLFFLVGILFAQSSFSQYTVSGKVIDADTRDPLPFVNIVFNNNQLTGISTDINGKFTYTSDVRIDALICSYVGYNKVTLSLDSTDVKPLLIPMESSSYTLGEIVVKAGENPANRIIRNVIHNKDINNPEKISSFRYKSYNKVIYDFDLSDTTVEAFNQEEFDEVFKGGHLFVMESVTERKFIHPDNSEEVILGTKVSGFKHASFAPLATDIQPFSFYNDILTIIDIDYLNPISNGSLTKYDFRIEDTLYAGIDTTFILSYKPQSGKNFEALTGLLYVNTNTYAIQNVIAKPFSRGYIDVSLQQQYRFVDGKQWFPEQLKFELVLRQTEDLTIGMRAGGVSFIQEVELYPDIKKKDFSIDAIRMDDLANERDSIYWEEHRTVPLSTQEEITYQVMDSLGEEHNFDGVLKFFERVGQNKIPIGFIDLDISRFLLYNKYEGIRLGMGVYTNDKLIKDVAVGGYFGFGFKDSGWKYGVDGKWTINHDKELVLAARYENTLQETGKSYLGYFRPRSFDFRTFLASQMDHIEKRSVSLGMRAMRYAKINVAFSNTLVDPQYPYTFQTEDGFIIRQYSNTDITINLRYAHKEKLVKSMGQRFGLGTKFPVLTVTYTGGMRDVFSSDFTYHKMEARLEESIYFRNFGESRFRLDAGYISKPLPYGQMFTGEGSFTRNWSVLIKNSFMTATPYEFLSDRYVNFHYSHDFGSLLLHVGNWKPTVSVYQNIGYGTLSHPEYQQNITFQTKEKGLYESGLQVDNILRFNYFKVSYVGFGAGAFMRYGPYASGRFSDDAVFTFSMTVTTK